MLIIGLTGGIATGKSTVSQQLQSLGVPIVDADAVARKVLLPGSFAYYGVIRTFGRSILIADDTLPDPKPIDRTKLGALVFSHPEKKKQLEKWTHPMIRLHLVWEILVALFRGVPVLVLDVPLLFESRLDRFCHCTVLVNCDVEQQLDRLMQRDNRGKEDAENRIKAQWPLEKKRERADYIIDNRGSRDELIEKVTSQLQDIEDDFRHIAKNRWHQAWWRFCFPLAAFFWCLKQCCTNHTKRQ